MALSPPPSRTLVARLDSVGDVLLAGPAVRAAAIRGPVTLLTSPTGAAAGALLPGVDELVTFSAPWILAEPPPVVPARLDDLVARLSRRVAHRAALLGSSHQSPLPMALVCRLAGVPRIAAVSHDYGGSLLDLRIPGDPDVHEVERNLLVTDALGCRLPADDDARLRVELPDEAPPTAVPAGYVALHPGASVPARRWHAERWIELAAHLRHAGVPVVVTGRGDHERAVAAAVAGAAGPYGFDRSGATSLASLAAILAGAVATVVGNTGPMHLSAAVGTPVVALFAPTVPPSRWHPWGVPYVLLGDLDIACRGCRARRCPRPDHECLDTVAPGAVLDALRALDAAMPAARALPSVRVLEVSR